jgi:hypothetical protein
LRSRKALLAIRLVQTLRQTINAQKIRGLTIFYIKKIRTLEEIPTVVSGSPDYLMGSFGKSHRNRVTGRLDVHYIVVVQINFVRIIDALSATVGHRFFYEVHLSLRTTVLVEAKILICTGSDPGHLLGGERLSKK